MDILIKALASGLYLGYLPYAPGTFGTLLGVALFLLLSLFSPFYYVIFAVIFFFAASFISSKAEILYKKKDPGIIVIDEITGFIVTMAFIRPGFYNIILGFIFFRFFDILKIWPVSFFNKKNGGFAVVLDDVAAGIYANILLRLSLKYLQ